jgi:hypothetical protein
VTKQFPETKDNSQPITTPTTTPVTMNFKIFFATLPSPVRQMDKWTAVDERKGDIATVEPFSA